MVFVSKSLNKKFYSLFHLEGQESLTRLTPSMETGRRDSGNVLFIWNHHEHQSHNRLVFHSANVYGEVGTWWHVLEARDNTWAILLHWPRETQRVNNKLSEGKERGYMGFPRAGVLPPSWEPRVGKVSENVLEERRFQ